MTGTSLSDSAINIGNYKRVKKTALLLGNEADGLSADYTALSDVLLKIPISCSVDSLNVSVAAGIVLYILSSLDT